MELKDQRSFEKLNSDNNNNNNDIWQLIMTYNSWFCFYVHLTIFDDSIAKISRRVIINDISFICSLFFALSLNVLDTWITTDVVVADRTLSFHSNRAQQQDRTAEEVAVSRHILPRPVPVLPMNGARESLLFSPVKATASERALPRVARES